MSVTGTGLWRTRFIKQFVQTVSQVSGLSTGLWHTRLVKQFVQTVSQVSGPTPSIAFRHLPPNSARFSYATEGRGTLYLCASVHRLGQRPPKVSGTNMTVEATKRQSTHVNMRRIHPGKEKEFPLDSKHCGFICAGVNFVGGYK